MVELLLVANQSEQTLDVLDSKTLQLQGRLTDLIAQPHEIAWDTTRKVAYLAHTYRLGGYGEGKPKAHEISVVDPITRTVVDVIDISPYEAPHDVEFDPHADLLYATTESNEAGNGLVVIDASTRKIIAAIPVDAPNAHWVSLTPDGTTAFLSHKDAEWVTVVDLVGRRQIAMIESPGGAEEIDCSPDGRFAFVAAPMMSLVVDVARGRLAKSEAALQAPRPHLMKIDVATHEVIARLFFDDFLAAVRVAPDGRVLVSEFALPEAGSTTTGPVNGRLHIVDGESLELIASVVVDELPFTSRVTSDGQTAFVANVKTGTVSVIDLNSYTLKLTVPNNVGAPFGGTHGLCIASL